MELKENMYVRTDYGINKIKKLKDGFVIFEKPYKDNYGDIVFGIGEGSFLRSEYKFSHNIIDLIEEGDYVNGKKVIEKYHSNKENFSAIRFSETEVIFKENNIVEILTKEQYEANVYRLED